MAEKSQGRRFKERESPRPFSTRQEMKSLIKRARLDAGRNQYGGALLWQHCVCG